LESGSPRAYHSGKICVGTTVVLVAQPQLSMVGQQPKSGQQLMLVQQPLFSVGRFSLVRILPHVGSSPEAIFYCIILRKSICNSP